MLRIAFVLLALLAVDVAAQSRFQETLEVRLLEIDARVVDRDGNPVHGLGAADFVLLEDGRRIDIESFYEVRASTSESSAPQANLEESAPSASVVTKPRLIVFFLDQLPLNADERRKVFADLSGFAGQVLRDGDAAAVIGWALEARTLVPLTRDRQRVIATLDAFAGDLDSIPDTMPYATRTAMVEDLSAALADGGRSPGAGWGFDIEEERRLTTDFCAQETLAEARRKSSTLQAVVKAMSGDHTAALVYVSNRMPANTQVYCRNLGTRSTGAGPGHPLFSTMNLLRELGRSANAAGVTLYSLRPDVPKTMPNAMESGLPGSGTAGMRDSALIANELESLGILAEATGGVVGYSPKEIKVALATIESDLDSYYSIAYRSTSDGRDRERKIRIETKDESLTVRARQTLVDKSDLTSAKETLVANLYGVTDTGDFTVAARKTGETTKRKRRLVHTEVRFRPESLTFVQQGNNRVATYRVLIVSSDELGALSDWTEGTRKLVEPEDKTKPLSLEFDLEMMPEGTMTAIGIFDETTGIAGFAVLDTRVGEVR